jgi:antitoxin component of MazEF toxin-antitoxin module
VPFSPRRRHHRVLLRRWSHSLAVRLPARLLREAGFSEDMPLSAELDSDGSLRLRAMVDFDRLRFSWDQQQRLEHWACTEPTWPLLRQMQATAAPTGTSRMLIPARVTAAGSPAPPTWTQVCCCP